MQAAIVPSSTSRRPEPLLKSQVGKVGSIPEFAVELEGLTRRFGDFVAVDDLTLRVPKGEIFGFLGLNGAGKTTTLRMMLGMIRPHAGRISLLGQPVTEGGNGPWEQVGYMVETPAAYPELTVRENLEIYRRLRGLNDPDAIERTLRRLKLEPYAHRRAEALSLGNRQRLGLAKALLHNPQLLLIDEPANGLDPAGVVEIRHLLETLAREEGVTIFMSSHTLEEVDRLVDRIAILHHGRLVEELDASALDRVRRAWLKVVVSRPEAAQAALADAGVPSTLKENALALAEPEGSSAPERVAAILARAGLFPSYLAVQKESLEAHFLAAVQKAEAHAAESSRRLEQLPADPRPDLPPRVRAPASTQETPSQSKGALTVASQEDPASLSGALAPRVGWTQAFVCELLKLRRSKVLYLSSLGMMLLPAVMSLMMVILRDPEGARRRGLIGQKALMQGGSADWATFLSMMSQGIAVGGSLVLAVCAAWLFGREFSEHTLKDLLALPTSRSASVLARLVTFFLWAGWLVMEVLGLGLLAGTALALPGAEPSVVAGGITRVLEAGVLVAIVSLPVAWIASLGRGYLAPMGFALLTLFVAQVVSALGWGAYCPWAVPALFSGMGGEAAGGLQPISIPLVGMTGLAGVFLTLQVWRKSDQVG